MTLTKEAKTKRDQACEKIADRYVLSQSTGMAVPYDQYSDDTYFSAQDAWDAGYEYQEQRIAILVDALEQFVGCGCDRTDIMKNTLAKIRGGGE